MLKFKTNSKKYKSFKRKAEHGFTTFLDVYVVLILAYSALVLANLLPAVDIARKTLVISLGLFCLVRVVVGFSRSHTDMLE